ncbi:hypothetical protein TH9_20845 [Thalassospira xiamenensis]|nr:hypothetical protein TH9_20845 [Thalassospira xiamenensis]
MLSHGKHTNPAIDDPRFGMTERTIGPLAADPGKPIQSRQAKPAAPGITKRHRPDGPHCPEQAPAALG